MALLVGIRHMVCESLRYELAGHLLKGESVMQAWHNASGFDKKVAVRLLCAYAVHCTVGLAFNIMHA